MMFLHDNETSKTGVSGEQKTVLHINAIETNSQSDVQ